MVVNKKKFLLSIFLVGFFLLTLLLGARETINQPGKGDTDKKESVTKAAPEPGKPTAKEPGKKGFELRDWISIGVLFIALASLSLNLYLFLKRKRERREQKFEELEIKDEFIEKKQVLKLERAEKEYCAALREELGCIDVPGSPDIDCKAVKLDATFVPLRISHTWRSEDRFDFPKNIAQKIEMDEVERHLSPEEVMKRAFQKYRLLLIIGDPGSGKTTLLKYYAMRCLDKEHRHFGFSQEIMPIFFPLRELEFSEKDEPLSLPANLAAWSEKHLMDITTEQFRTWLQKSQTLVLLDGLDEISSKKRRRKVCAWIKNMCTGLGRARFVVTSRATGYRKLDGIELDFEHLRADILDFTLQQQEDFLDKWFRAVYLSELNPGDLSEAEWQYQQKKRAGLRSKKIIEFLKKKDNKAVQELATVPMLLQITAIIWKERKHLPKTRPALFDAALNYLLDYRDRQREIEPLLPADEARLVLAPTALWMQEELQKDEALKKEMYNKMQPILDTLTDQPQAETFCDYLRDRAGVLADYDRDHYGFRHKSFREYLSAQQLREDYQQPGRIAILVNHFKEDWWEEPLRFFMNKANDKIFDEFMRLLFQSEVSKQLDAHRQTLLQNLVTEAPQKRIDGLVQCLMEEDLNSNQARCILDCLKTIATPEALGAVRDFMQKAKAGEANLEYAEDIAAEYAAVQVPVERARLEEQLKLKDTADSFRSPFEDNVEYIRIPDGSYKYSLTGKLEAVPDLYFCKYPVTNKRYRRFISYLAGDEKGLEKMLPMKVFAEILLEFSESVEGYTGYLGREPEAWSDKLRSTYNEDKRFKEDDQPVVGITWYAARFYCFWLSCLQAASKGDKTLENIERSAGLFRLPTEVEWEWAAAGREEDGALRKYPWPKSKGKPTPDLANYNKNVEATTPVGRYPDGATPEGLLDMAGNVWEWVENKYREDEHWRALRGGSWYDYVSYLRCAARDSCNPDGWNDYIGFRVVRPNY